MRRMLLTLLLGWFAVGIVTHHEPPARAADEPAEALLVGDSVMNAMQQPYGAPGAPGAR